mgnify:CR=1 FL=1
MIDIDLKFYLSLLWRRLPWVLVIWVTLSAAGITVAYILPPVYLSSGTILVVPPQIQGPSAQVPAPQQLQTIRQRLMTRPTLLDMAERLRIFDKQPELSPADRVAAMQDATTFKQITIGQGGRRAPPGAVAFTVSFENADANLAARVANEMVTLILELNQTIRIELASGTVDFYEQEVSRLQNELTDLEQQLANFKTENAGTLPSTLPLRIQQVNGLKGQIDQLEIIRPSISDPEVILRNVTKIDIGAEPECLKGQHSRGNGVAHRACHQGDQNHPDGNPYPIHGPAQWIWPRSVSPSTSAARCLSTSTSANSSTTCRNASEFAVAASDCK